MIGRGCLKNPRIFAQARGGDCSELAMRPLPQIMKRLQEYLEDFYDERLMLIQMRKFAAWYSSGYRGAAAFRKELFALQDRQAVLSRIYDYFAEADTERPEDTSHEAFLMGGHG
jgi:tRNA-dihydrouridine synthase